NGMPSHSSYRVVTLPVSTSTRWIEPCPQYVAGGGPGKVRPMTSMNSKQPPLLHTSTAPSGPTAAPFGPPPHSATTSMVPLSTSTRLNVPRAISTSTTLPSSIAIGPSGNRNPLTISLNSAMPGCLVVFLAPRTRFCVRGARKSPSGLREDLVQLFGGHEDVAGLRSGGRADDAALLEQVHEPTGAGESDAELALQH